MSQRSDPAARPHATPAAEHAVRALLGHVPALEDLRCVEVLEGGLTNRNYKVTTGTGERYVARLSSSKSSLLAIDREAECHNSQAAARAGVGPRVVDRLVDEQVLVVEWIDGRTFTDDDLDDATTLSRVAAVCSQLHAGPRFACDFDMFDIQRGYLQIVQRHGFRLPAGYLDHAPVVRRMERALRATAAPTVPCHNDLLAANILDDGARLWLIDYEYSGNNDAGFELGNIWSEAVLAPDRLEHLVEAYLGRRSPVQVARARLFGLMSKYGWTLWASIQNAVSDVDFDFWQWGMHKYERACAEFAGPELDDLISTVEESVRP